MTFVVTESCIRCKYTDCVDVCPVDCFYEGLNFLVIHPDECIRCGACVAACPRALIKLHPVEDNRLLVLCNNHDPAAIARKVCKVACIGCGQCVRRDPDQAVTLQNNLAVVNYAAIRGTHEETVDKCPTKSILYMDLKEPILRG